MSYLNIAVHWAWERGYWLRHCAGSTQELLALRKLLGSVLPMFRYHLIVQDQSVIRESECNIPGSVRNLLETIKTILGHRML